MSPRKKTTMKLVGAKPSGSSQHTIDMKSARTVYNGDTSILLEKGETLKWGEVYYMFKKSNFYTEAKDPGEL
jgi:hypothetical protein